MGRDALAQLNDPRTQTWVAATCVLVLTFAAWLGPEAIILAALPLAFWFAVRFPTVWIIVFMALSQYRIPDALPPIHGLHLPLAFGAMALAAMVWHIGIARTYPAVWRRELVAMLVLLALSLIGLIFALDRPRSQTFVIDNYWKIIAIAFALAWVVRREIDFRRIAIATLISGTIIGLVANYNKVFEIDLVEGTRVTIGQNFNSPLSDPNDLALVLMAPFCISLAMLACRVERRLMLLAAVTAVTTLLGIIATQSRGGLLAVLAGIGVIGIHLIRSRNVLYMVVAAAGLLLFVVMGIGGRQSGGFAELSESGLDQSSYLRTLVWTAAVNMALERPYTGVGIAGFPSAFFFYTPEWVQRDLAPHSTWFGMLGEMGVPGLVVLLMMLARAIFSVQRAKSTLDSLAASPLMRAMALGLKSSLITFCVSGTFLGQHTTWPLYTLVALTVAISTYAERYAAAADTNVADTADIPHRTPSSAGSLEPAGSNTLTPSPA